MEDTSAQTRMLKAIWSNGVLQCLSCLARNTEQTWYNITFRDDSFCLLHLCNVNFNLDHSYWSQLTSIGQSGDSTIQILIQFIFYFEHWKVNLKKNKLNWWLEDHATDCCKSTGSTPSTINCDPSAPKQSTKWPFFFFFFLLRIVCVADQHRQPDGHKHTGSWLSKPTIDTKAERRSFALPGSRHICRNYSPNYPYKRWD